MDEATDCDEHRSQMASDVCGITHLPPNAMAVPFADEPFMRAAYIIIW